MLKGRRGGASDRINELVSKHEVKPGRSSNLQQTVRICSELLIQTPKIPKYCRLSLGGTLGGVVPVT